MPAGDRCDQITITLPHAIVEQIEAMVGETGSTLESESARLIELGLRTKQDVRRQWRELSESYRARLSREGKLEQSPEDVMEELRRIREQVADELYTD